MAAHVSGGTTVLAAGAVVRRSGPSGTEVLLVHRPRYDDWSFPKGKLDREEHEVLAAVREVAEETGLTVRLERPLPQQRYTVSGRPKQVHYWLATALSGSFAASDEVDRAEWLSVGEARDRLTWQRDGDLLDAVTGGPDHTTAVLVVRHTQAVDPADWQGDDDLRPLDATGVARSAVLAALLASYAPERVICSDTVRALETVRAYADLAHLTVEVSPLLGGRLTESGTEAVAPQAVAAEAATFRLSPVPLLLCTHGSAIRPLLDALLDGRRGPGPSAPPAPGDLLVLHFASGELVAHEHHRAA